MKKNKTKKGRATKNTKNKTLLGGAGKSLRKLGSGIGRLSTTQKVAGGAAIVALGLSLLNKRRKGSKATADTSPDATGAEQNLATMDGGAI